MISLGMSGLIIWKDAERNFRDHKEANIVIVFIGNRANLHRLPAVSTRDALSYGVQCFRGMSAFVKVLTQICHVVSKKALNLGDDPTAFLKRRTITIRDRPIVGLHGKS